VTVQAAELADLVRMVERDGEPTVLLTCPRCGTEGEIDDDQAAGRVSIECATAGCDFHETVDLRWVIP
jgi:hypothetical protein